MVGSYYQMIEIGYYDRCKCEWVVEIRHAYRSETPLKAGEKRETETGNGVEKEAWPAHAQ